LSRKRRRGRRRGRRRRERAGGIAHMISTAGPELEMGAELEMGPEEMG
jgi:hypothetical protein